MQMYFVFSNNVTLLFDFWTVHTLTGLILSFVVVLFLTVLYEVSKVWKSNLLSRVLLTIPGTPDLLPTPSQSSDLEADAAMNSDPLLPGDSFPNHIVDRASSSTCRWWLLHCFVSLLHTVQVVLGYLIMLCVMSYNAAIFLSVIIGSALGYYLAFPLLSKYPKPHIL
uniref:Copper transport protein n=1 Tax=Leptobrachium leishanense TaxID=445787 RepID=A0A8C5R5K1_9ANUR